MEQLIDRKTKKHQMSNVGENMGNYKENEKEKNEGEREEGEEGEERREAI